MRHKFLKSKSCRNEKLCIYLSEKGRRDVVLAAICCFSNLKVKDTLYRALSDWFAFSAPELCKDKCITNYVFIYVIYYTFQISAQAEYTHFHNRLLCSYIKKYINIYKTIYHWVLSKYISGFRKQRPHGDMDNNYVLLSGFHWLCWLVCFVDNFDYFLIQIMFQRLWTYDCLLHCNMQYIIVEKIEFPFGKLEQQKKTFT